MNALWKLLKTYLKKYFSLCYGIVKTAVIDFVERFITHKDDKKVRICDCRIIKI